MKTRKFCPYCGRPVVKSRTKGYAFQCYGCDEDFYRLEVNTTKQIEIVRYNRKESYLSCVALNRKTIRSFKKPYPRPSKKIKYHGETK